MKSTLRIVGLVFVLALSLRAGRSQQTDSPAASGPTLDVTLNFIAGKINDTGVIHTHEHMGYLQAQYDYDNNWGTTSAKVDVPNCAVFYYSFKKPRSVRVMTMLQSENEDDDPGNFSRTIAPMPYVVKLGGQKGDTIVFLDMDTANRVAKAVQHAMDLCGGGSKDPF